MPSRATSSSLPPWFRVLLAGDRKETEGVLVSLLARAGVEVWTVGDVASAAAHLRTGILVGAPWHAVILNWEHPTVEEALQLAIEIRADEVLAHTPLVAISRGRHDPATAIAMGLAAVLTEPLQKETLLRCLARLAAASIPPPATSVLERLAPGPAVAQRLRLLLAEDNPANQLVSARLLTRLGHAVTVAKNGMEALRHLKEQPYDAVLMDCEMPVLDGFEATRRIRAGAEAGIDARTPVIALTTCGGPNDRRRGLASGMNMFLTKPLRTRDLRAAFANCGLAGDVPASPPAEE